MRQCELCGKDISHVRQRHKRCPTCRIRIYRSENPIKAAYNLIKSSAKRRGIYFALTLEYFNWWCNDTGYVILKGIRAMDMTIDRIKPELGYIDGNIQMITNQANARKRWHDTKGWGIQGLQRQAGDPF